VSGGHDDRADHDDRPRPRVEERRPDVATHRADDPGPPGRPVLRQRPHDEGPGHGGDDGDRRHPGHGSAHRGVEQEERAQRQTDEDDLTGGPLPRDGTQPAAQVSGAAVAAPGIGIDSDPKAAAAAGADSQARPAPAPRGGVAVEGPDKPELQVAGAFVGAFLFARILKKITE
jgi:hypothetical protein